MTKAIRNSSLVLILLSGASFLAWLVPSRETVPEMIIDQTGLKGVHAEPNQKIELSFQVENRGRSNLWIVGAVEGCAPDGCVEVRGLPLTVPAGGRRSIAVEFSSGQPGEFTREFPIFTDHPTDRKMTLAVQGVVVQDRESQPSPTPPEP